MTLESDPLLICAKCKTLACTDPDKDPTKGCPSHHSPELLSSVRGEYTEEETRALAAHAARTEAAGYCKETRVEEIMSYARRLGVKHLGIACCIGTQREAKLASEIFEAGGFRVSSVLCKVGSIPKEEIGIQDEEKIRPGQFEALCNPLAQAKLLEQAGAELNVVVGLCVGHDTLFFRASQVPVTVLMVKDRVTGHNPAAALYTSHSYYRRLTGK